MKKFMKLSIATLLVLAMAFSMAACGGSDSKDSEKTSKSEEVSIVGDWVLSTIVDAEGNEYTLEEYCEQQGVDSQGMEMTLSPAEDGTLSAAIGGVEATGTYEFDGKTLTYTMDSNGQGASMTYDAESDTLYSEDADTGMQSILERQ